MRLETSRGQALADLRQILFRPNASIFATKTYSKARSQKTGTFTKVESATFSPLARSFLDEKKHLKHTYPKAPVLRTEVDNARNSHPRSVGNAKSKAATADCLAELDSNIRQEPPQDKRANRASNGTFKKDGRPLGQKFRRFEEERLQSKLGGQGMWPSSGRISEQNYPALQNDWSFSEKNLSNEREPNGQSTKRRCTKTALDGSSKFVDGVQHPGGNALYQTNVQREEQNKKTSFKEGAHGKIFGGTALDGKDKKDPQWKKEEANLKQQDEMDRADRKLLDRMVRVVEAQNKKFTKKSTSEKKIEIWETFNAYEKPLLDGKSSKNSFQHQQDVVVRKTLGEKDLNQQTPQQQENPSALQKARRGKLSNALARTIWGPTPRKQPGEDEKREAEVDELIKKIRRRKEEAAKRSAECLMDVLLKNWIYFQHAHASLQSNFGKKDVHAKYCEGAFGHYLLSDGTQVHGSYVISLRQLIAELKSLMSKLKAKLFKSTYKESPKWTAPKLEQMSAFSAPEQPPMPKLYPIEGLLALPEDDIPLDSTMPLLRTPTLKQHPAYSPPKLHKKPVPSVNLDLPSLPDFSQEEKRLAEPPVDIPMPVFKMPELLPLPAWEEPKEDPLPARPVEEVAKVILQPLETEVIPPYEGPKLEVRPCEASYYHGAAEGGRIPICDGQCGRVMSPRRSKSGQDSEGDQETSRDLGPCLAKRPRLLPLPIEPTNFDEIPEPTFTPPSLEPLPPFIPPVLKPMPEYMGPPAINIPQWTPPPPPLPIGYLAGQRPVFLIDCSSSMAGDSLVAAQDAIRHLFSKNGQVDIAATHFDIIMYSFDSWSFGARMEEEKQNRIYRGASRPWMKTTELMQEKTPENMEKALNWLSRWSTGGASNLVRAIELAMSRTSADCIYLFTHGKCDKPVIIMNALKELELDQRLIPIFPVGIECTKPQARILKSVLADMTGGRLIELALKWQYELYFRQKKASEDDKWLQSELEFWQRKSMEESHLGAHPHRMEIILEHLKWQFHRERIVPLLAFFQKEEEKAQVKHQIALDRVRAENEQILMMARSAYEKIHSTTLNRNKQTLEDATTSWETEVKRVRAFNLERRESHEAWKKKIRQIEEANRISEEEGRCRYFEEVKRIEERNSERKLHGKDEHEILVKKLKELNDRRMTSHRKQQEEIIFRAKARYSVILKAYEDECAAIREQNARNAENARAKYTADCETVIQENQRRMKEAEADYKWKIEITTLENSQKKAEHLAKTEALEAKKREARRLHHELFAQRVAKQKASIAEIAANNNLLEQEAKLAWEEACKSIDEENKMITTKAYQEWRDAAHKVQLENEQFARRRINLQLRRDEVERMNAELVRKKKADWKDACQRLELAYEEEVARAKFQHQQYEKELQVRNVQTLEAAKEAFEAKKEAVAAYNESIRPQVQASEAVQWEIDKIREFLGHIVRQSYLPPEKKHAKKRTLEQSLDMLAALDSPCPPKMVIAALQAAFASDMERMKSQAEAADRPTASIVGRTRPDGGQQPHPEHHHERQRRLSQRRQGRFSNMVPIEPARVTPHSCAGGRQLDADLREYLAYHEHKIGKSLRAFRVEHQGEDSATSVTKSASTSVSGSVSLPQSMSRTLSHSISQSMSQSVCQPVSQADEQQL